MNFLNRSSGGLSNLARQYRCTVSLAVLCWITATPLFSAGNPFQRYALILSDPPMAARVNSRAQAQSATANDFRRRIRTQQQDVRHELEARRIPVVGSVEYLLNAVFVQAPEERESELRTLRGVQVVIPVPRYKLKLNRAVRLVNGPQAWNTMGGVQNAGTGMKIAILDTGIDQTHPAFQDSSLTVPPGFPKCEPANCAFTNNKVIVARSYVRQLAAGSAPNPAADSRPDDLSPRDRIGHGTAVASVAAGATNNGPAATITGMAPKAFLGNYKIFGSPGVNDFSDGAIIVMALEDALNDGMDIASLSLGASALSGPLDRGSVCGNPVSVPCDFQALAVENAVRSGMIVTAAAGNEGSTGRQSFLTPTFSTITSPATAPSAITVGASTNSHNFTNSVRVPGANVPSSLQQLAAFFGDGPYPEKPFTAPMRDVARLQMTDLHVAAYLPGSLTGAFGLIQRGSCSLIVKVRNAEAVGAVGVIFYMNDQEAIVSPRGLAETGIPAVMISNSDGLALKNFIDANTDRLGTMDTSLFEIDDAQAANTLAFFSSLGPPIGEANIKPDLVAVGTLMYMATQSYDADSGLYSPDRYLAASGTSFSTPMVAGAAALVKQKNPRFTPLQVKSALVNTATQDVTGNSGGPGNVSELGGGKLDANTAVNAMVTSVPATLAFGALTSTSVFPITRSFLVTNHGLSAANLTITVASRVSDPRATLTVDKQSLSLVAGGSSSVSVTLSGSLPAKGSYEGAIILQGGTVSLRVPYLYLVGDQVPFDLVPLVGEVFGGTVNETISEGIVAFKLIDSLGLPVPDASVSFRVARGGGTIQSADTKTNQYGIATAVPVLGPQPCLQTGCQEFVGSSGGFSYSFRGVARSRPAIAPNGIVNAASFESAKAVAPGSYISIFGSALSDFTDSAQRLPLPLGIDYVNVSFDVPSVGLSLPGRLLFVSPGQVNLQVPWELQGQSSVQVKVTIDFTAGNVYTLPLAPYSPGFFEFQEGMNSLAASLDEFNRLIRAGNPALRGRTIQMFANGLGPVTNQPRTGEASGTPLSLTTSTPVVTIGGKPATVTFSGLAPGFPALYQVNVIVPPDTLPGIQPIIMSMGGVASKVSSLPIQ